MAGLGANVTGTTAAPSAVRAVVWRHPAWDVDELVFSTRRDGLIFPDVSSIGLPWVGSPGGDLHLLTVDRTGRTFGTRRPLLKDRLAPGHETFK